MYMTLFVLFSLFFSNTKSFADYECPAPGTVIDCMPKINVKPNFYCKSEVREWVMQHCEEVEFLD